MNNESVKTLNLATINQSSQKMIGGFNPSKFALRGQYNFKSAEKINARENTIELLKANDMQERYKRYQELLIRRQNNTNYWQ